MIEIEVNIYLFFTKIIPSEQTSIVSLVWLWGVAAPPGDGIRFFHREVFFHYQYLEDYVGYVDIYLALIELEEWRVLAD